jgi:hypothetical protein
MITKAWRITVLALVALSGCTAHVGVQTSEPPPGADKVLVCHKGKTLEIGAPALEAHLKHGDSQGPCA